MGRRGKQSGLGGDVRDGIGVRDTAQLDVASCGELQRSGAVLCGRMGKRRELWGVDHPARESYPGKRAIGGLMHVERTGAGVVALSIRPAVHPTHGTATGWLRRRCGAVRRVRMTGVIRPHRPAVVDI